MTHQKEVECADGGDVEYLPLYYYDLTPRLIQQAKEELFENADTTQAALDEFRTLIITSDKNNLGLPTEDVELLPFLRARKYDVSKAYATYIKCFSQFRVYHKLFKNIQYSSILRVIQSNIIGFLVKRDDDRCAVALSLFRNWNPSVFNATDVLKAVVFSTMDVIRCPITQIVGVKIIVDFSGLSLRHLLTIRPWHLMYMAEYIQKATPLRFKGFHILNHGHLFHYIWRLLSPMLSEKVLNRIHFHGDNPRSLHRFFSPTILPEEFGGNTGPYDPSGWIETFAQSENYFTTKINKFS